MIAFHDFWVVLPAILGFLRETPGARGYFLRNNVFVVEIGDASVVADSRIQSQLRVHPRVWRFLASAGAGPLVQKAFRLGMHLRKRLRRGPGPQS